MPQYTETERVELRKRFPEPPDGCSLMKVDYVPDPKVGHMYTIGPKHVALAADSFGGMLGESALAEAHKRGIHCAHQYEYRATCQLPFSEHKTLLTLFIRVPRKKDLNDVPGLHAYLMGIKDLAAEVGIQTFAFPS